MEHNKDILIIWMMASLEAGKLQWADIYPQHFLGAALKFVEFKEEELRQLVRADIDFENIKVLRDNLKKLLIDKWLMNIPGDSTRLRRILRQPGDGIKKPKSSMLHRSDSSRSLFKKAYTYASSKEKFFVDAGDLIDVILSEPDEFISRAISKSGLDIKMNNKIQEDKITEDWKDILSPLSLIEYKNEDEEKAALKDPVAAVLRDNLTKKDLIKHRPFLLINDSQTKGEEFFLRAISIGIKKNEDKKNVVSIPSNKFLTQLINNRDSFDQSFLGELLDSRLENLIYYFNSINNYFSNNILDDQFIKIFSNWIKQTDGRFFFEISSIKYSELIEHKKEWKDVFNLIWINEISDVPDKFEL